MHPVIRLVSLAQKSPVKYRQEEGINQSGVAPTSQERDRWIFRTFEWFSLGKIRSEVIVELLDGFWGKEVANKTTPGDLQAFDNSLKKLLMRHSSACVEVADSRKRPLIWTNYRRRQRHCELC